MHNGETSGSAAAGYRAQLAGMLSKKHHASQGGSSSKWAKRFFVVRDGFLLHYPESERREYEKHHSLNLHPKGIVPLGTCEILCVSETLHPFSLQISGSELAVPLILATETEHERDKWLNVLQQSARVTWSNWQLGDVMIRQLENHGLQMAKEKQDYVDKLQVEALALHDEKLRADELEMLNSELAKERQKLERLASELSEEYEHIKHEFTETQAAMKSVEDTKLSLLKMTGDLEARLEGLEQERMQMLLQLKDREVVANGNGHELSTGSGNRAPPLSSQKSLERDLKVIEDRAKKLLADKADAEQRLSEFTERERQLEEEKRVINEHANELKESLEDVKAQKAMTEAELKEEVMARLAAERRLQEAEQRLHRLECGIQSQGKDGRAPEETKEEMIGDVKAIRQFFESLAAEARLDSEKSVMMKNTVHARKVIVRRAQTLKYETLRKQRKSKTMSRDSTLEEFAKFHTISNK